MRKNKLHKRKKLSYREMQAKLKEDPFVKAVNQTTEFAKKYSQMLIAGLLVVVVGIVAGKLYLNHRASQEFKSGRLLFKAQDHIGKNEWDLALSTLDEILKQYGSTDAAQSAQILVPSVKVAQGKYDEAIQEYETLLTSSKGEVAEEIRFSLANLYQSKGDFEQALKRYSELETKQDFSRKNELLYQKGRALEAMNRYSEAKDAYNAIPSDTESAFYGMAQDRLQWIRAMGQAG